MAVNQVTQAQVESDLRNALASLNQSVQNWTLLYNLITAIGTAGLQAAPYSYSSGDATNIFNAATDLYRLGQVAQGLYYVASGATLNSGAPTANDASHFGYPFVGPAANINKVGGQGF